MEKRRVIRVFPDWGNRWPLWGSAGDDDSAPMPADLGLSDELTGAMAKWYDFWTIHFHWERGWDSVENEDVSWVSGTEFIERLRVEVAEFADVVDERYRP
jgi:hypothetical protein